MSYGIKVKLWGDYACFTRPEMKAERVSYEIITPSAARGILEAIYWKPEIRWVIDKVHVLNKIQFDNIRRNEVAGKISESKIKSALKGTPVDLYQSSNADRQQRATMLLKNVAYIIEAHFEMTGTASGEDTPEKHYNIVLRRLRKGQFFHHPYFGCREFPVHFELVEDEIPCSSLCGKTDLGWMLWDIDFANGMNPLFFHAEMINGIVRIPDRSEVIT